MQRPVYAGVLAARMVNTGQRHIGSAGHLQVAAKINPPAWIGEQGLRAEIITMQATGEQLGSFGSQLMDEQILKAGRGRRIPHLVIQIQVAEPVGVTKQIHQWQSRNLRANGDHEITQSESPDKRRRPEFQAACQFKNLNASGLGE